MRKTVALIFFLSAIFFGWAFKYTYSTKVQEPNIDAELKQVATQEYLNQKIEDALNQDKIDDAKSYIGLANYLNVPIHNDLRVKVEKQEAPIPSAIRKAKEFASGFITGKSENGASLSGSVVSDFTVVGDLRDTYKEGSKYLQGENYDKFLLNISLIGLAITASTYVSLGATAPLKTGEAVVKSAYKSGKLTKGFIKILDKKFSKSVDLKLVKNLDFSSFSKFKNSSKSVIKSINSKPFKSLFKKLNTIKNNTSYIDSVKLLKYTNNEKDLAKIAKISAKYKANTVGVFKLLGKRVLRAGKVVVKYTSKFILNIAGFLLSLLGFFITLFFGHFVGRKIL